ncbi:MAG: efflux transporter outer membrane subunit [Gammaproteobacteria bacterium]|nr:efflux transporter outer membrane subunit [Gammaproteobacteria bacterium]
MNISSSHRVPPAAQRARRGSWIFLPLLPLLLSACAAVPSAGRTPEHGVAVPPAWSGEASAGAEDAATALARWWERFDDPALTDLVVQALAANTDVRAARARLRQARAQRDVTAAGLGPSLTASASAQRSKQGDADAANQFRAGFDAGWEPDIFGATRSGVSAADADVLASAGSLADTRVSIAAETAVSYMQLRGFQARLAIARENLASQEQTLQLTQWRAQAGLATSLEVEQARAAVEQTRAQIPALEASATQTLNGLAVLTGRPPGASPATLTEAVGPPALPADLALAIPAETLRQRPDVRVAEQQVVAAAARIDQAAAARLPSFQLSGSLGLSALTVSGLSETGALLRSILAGVSLPVFDGGQRRAQVRAQEAAFDEARENYRAVVLAALQDVEDSLVALDKARARLAAQRRAAEAARNAALLADHRYASGLIDFQTVLETQRTLLSAQDGVAGTEAELGADYVRLYKSLGGGWTPGATDDIDDGPPPAAQGST